MKVAIPLSAQQERVLRAVAQRRGEPVDSVVARALVELCGRHPELLSSAVPTPEREP